MGAGHSKEDEYLLECILTDQEAEVEIMLRKDSERVNAPLLNGRFLCVNLRYDQPDL